MRIPRGRERNDVKSLVLNWSKSARDLCCKNSGNFDKEASTSRKSEKACLHERAAKTANVTSELHSSNTCCQPGMLRSTGLHPNPLTSKNLVQRCKTLQSFQSCLIHPHAMLGMSDESPGHFLVICCQRIRIRANQTSSPTMLWVMVAGSKSNRPATLVDRVEQIYKTSPSLR